MKIGLTGGIGSGKSEVARRLAAKGALVIDADLIAREVVEPGTPGLAEITATFGEAVLRPDGSLDREALGRIVFTDPGRLKALNAIVHPKVGARVAELQDAAPADAIVVYDVPLLAENDLAPMYDKVIVVDAEDTTRLTRLTTIRGMTPEDAEARIAAQATREARLAIADIVIDNNGPLSALDPQIAELWHELTDVAP
ncbi:dephospho-CoA kinase [Acrocarpospora phusangensis]|uniref:Dephospho-CoA kinase n=1 Tax=Acrocarpospora phusangensis TaxID=1070424 RepID=A0A919QFB7_9ACTN|nr:dephospho-CoA kinase [Acrocarpospora phusangensis]